MLETTKKIVGEIEELKELAMSELCKCSMSAIADMGASEFKALQLSLKLFDDCTDLMVKQAEMIENQDKKLDKLLELMGKKG